MKHKEILKNAALLVATVALAILLGSQAPGLVKQWLGPFKNGDFSAHIANLPHKITLYATSTCPHCASARAFLEQAGVAFNYRLVDKSEEAKHAFMQLNDNSVPTLVSDKKLLVGFNQASYVEFIRAVK